ncbi:TetR family transcriptional regulator C-terminal domain-containing protein [Yoonia sp. BS5-3]|uniref:TetR family transcriptional regulator C-terminal domain-containing protein n=1 Tax=Yoonia phaeophyticola TaxID=3137369 RepID=A0ABZ2V3J2_9RHOB
MVVRYDAKLEHGLTIIQAKTPPDDGKTRLIKGAMHCVADHGISGSSVRRIAEYAGVTPGLVRHHFGNKDTLLAECYRDLNTLALQRMAQSFADDGQTLSAQLRAALHAFFPEDLRDVRKMRVLVAFWGAVLTTDAFADVQKETNSAFYDFLAGLLRRHLGDRADLAMLADAVMALIDGLWLECCMNPDHMTPEAAIERAHHFCCLALESLQSVDR